LPGLGAVSTTFIAGVEAIRRGLLPPVGSLTQSGTIRLGKRTEGRSPLIRDFVPLAALESLEFGAWDPIPDSAHEAARRAGVLSAEHLSQMAAFLDGIRPWKAVFEREWVKRLDGPHVKTGASKMELAEQLMDDIRRFRKDKGLDRLVMIWCGSTEAYRAPSDVHGSIERFERGLAESDPAIAPSMIYAYAAIKLGIPYANGAPNLSADIGALTDLARTKGAPLGGKDFKTGQTLMKTIIAPGLKARLLGLNGWYSTNILGNRDGEVLGDPESFRTKELSKLGVLEHIL
jgi:myo-inositol-1-phosphate synthase